MKECSQKCIETSTSCSNKNCRYWIEYSNDLNCSLIAIDKNDENPMTLKEVGKRLNMTLQNVSLIEQRAIKKLNNILNSKL